ncbi:MAG: DUF3857 domain-containing protein, partial [Kiritimatiellae bacterium]|nr:DUF3857 domain-containing protein [Kiritimatiellia bacterium]
AASPDPADFDPAPRYARAMATLGDVTAERFPDADTVAVFQWESTTYNEDGTYETEWTSVDKILTERGLESSKSQSLWNNDFYGSMTVLVARVVSPDGTARDIDLSENLAEAVDTSSLSDNIHDPNDKTFTLAFPGLAVGDAVETKVRRTIRKPRVEGVYADYLVFEQSGPVLWQGVRIEGPESLPLRSRAFRDAGPVALRHLAVTNSAAGTVAETWTAEDVPRYFPEPDMPPAYDCTARLVLSTSPDWESLSRWYARLCAPHLAQTNEAMAAFVSERLAAAGAAGDRDATIRTLFDFVSRDVRYMGAMAESEAPGYEPHDVSLTFGNRYGVCRDKAALLAALLRMAGVDAWPTLVHAGPRKDPDVPQPYFNHAIVAVDSGDPADPYVLMDPTSETTRSLLPEYLREKSYLVARHEGETIRETPALPAAENTASGETTVRFDAAGTAFCESEIVFRGINDAAYRQYFASMTSDGIRLFCQRLLSGATSGAALTSWSVSPEHGALRTDLSPLRLRIACEIPFALAPSAVPGGAGEGAGSVAAFSPPRFCERLAVASHVVGNLGLEKRRFPMETEYTCGFEETIRFEGAEPEPFDPTSFVSDGLRYEDSLEGATLKRSLTLMRSRFAPDEYAALRASREAEERSDRAPLFFRLAGNAEQAARGADAAAIRDVLSRAVLPEPEDDVYQEFSRSVVDLSDYPESWTVTHETRKKILTYAGQRKNSDDTISWQSSTCEVELLDAHTVSPDGTETPVNPDFDVFDGDQSWVADAPRYPAGKIKTISFPKVEPGAVLCKTVRYRYSGLDFFSIFHTFGSFRSFGEETVEIRGPKELRDKFSLVPPLWPGLVPGCAAEDVEKTETEDADIWRLRGRGPGSAIAAEADAPGGNRIFPMLSATDSTVRDRAEAVMFAMLDRSDPAVETNAAALARSLVPAGAPLADKIRAVRDWTDLHLRGAGPSWTSLPLAGLSHADDTLAVRYGHSADRQILRLAMARALGLFPEFRFRSPVWDVPGREDPLARPIGPGTIDSVTFAFGDPDDGGREYFLDGASRYAPLPFDANRDRAYVTVSPYGAKFAAPPSPPSMEAGDEGVSATESRTSVSLAEDGSARVSVRIRHRGADAEAFRRRYSQMLPEERRREEQKLAASVAQSARLAGPVVASFPPEGPCELSFETEIPDLAVRRGDALVFTADLVSFRPQTAPRRFPKRRTGTRRHAVVLEVSVPEGWRVSAAPRALPPAEDPRFGIRFERLVETDPAPGVALRVSDTACAGPAEFAPELYPELLAIELPSRGAASSTVAVEPVR